MSTFVGIYYIQLAVPPGAAQEVRRFYGDVLGLPEIEPPGEEADRGALWFQCGTHVLRLARDDDFHPARVAHPALQLINITTLNALEAQFVLEGLEVQREEGGPGFRGFKAQDPFGNRLEFVCPIEY